MIIEIPMRRRKTLSQFILIVILVWFQSMECRNRHRFYITDLNHFCLFCITDRYYLLLHFKSTVEEADLLLLYNFSDRVPTVMFVWYFAHKYADYNFGILISEFFSFWKCFTFIKSKHKKPNSLEMSDIWTTFSQKKLLKIQKTQNSLFLT